MSLNLAGKSVLVTGAGSGIGYAIAEEYAKAGAKVLATDLVESGLQALQAVAKASGGILEILKVNVGVQAEVEAMIDKAYTLFGRLDVLINNAGIMDNFSGVGDMSIELWNRVINVNVNGPMYALHHAVPKMVAQGGGSIINVCSLASLGGGTAGCAYTASKHALLGLTKSTAWHYATQGLRVNAICPGGTQTAIMSTVTGVDPVGYGRLEKVMATFPGFLQPKDVAGLALFLGSDLSGAINGNAITTDKGFSAIV